MFKAQRALHFLMTTPLVPPEQGPLIVELQNIDEDIPYTPRATRDAADSYPSSPATSSATSVELDPEAAIAVRAMVSLPRRFGELG